jgi:hypothetical protein
MRKLVEPMYEVDIPKGGFKTFNEFYSFYLGQHLEPMCRGFHIIGSTFVMSIIAYAVLQGQPKMLLWCPVANYSFAFLGHVVFEKNLPTFINPLYSLSSDFVLWYECLFAGRSFDGSLFDGSLYGKQMTKKQAQDLFESERVDEMKQFLESSIRVSMSMERRKEKKRKEKIHPSTHPSIKRFISFLVFASLIGLLGKLAEDGRKDINGDVNLLLCDDERWNKTKNTRSCCQQNHSLLCKTLRNSSKISHSSCNMRIK